MRAPKSARSFLSTGLAIEAKDYTHCMQAIYIQCVSWDKASITNHEKTRKDSKSKFWMQVRLASWIGFRNHSPFNIHHFLFPDFPRQRLQRCAIDNTSALAEDFLAPAANARCRTAQRKIQNPEFAQRVGQWD